MPFGSAFKLAEVDVEFGSYTGELVNRFIEKNNIQKEEIDCIASHGHTIFHEPEHGFTTQIGEGTAIAIKTGCAVINDFRSADIALGGQGAPLAPMADKLLLAGFDFYLNLGGIANLTANVGRFIAFDICGANQILNALAQEKGLTYDKGGELAAAGKLIPSLFNSQKKLPFFKEAYPKSLSNQWVQKNQVDAFSSFQASAEDRLHTACELISSLIQETVLTIIQTEGVQQKKNRLLITGGGAYNSYLIKRLEYYCEKINVEIKKPAPEIIDFKEALLMALMGGMYLEGVSNCMMTVTGAKANALGGAFHPKSHQSAKN